MSNNFLLNVVDNIEMRAKFSCKIPAWFYYMIAQVENNVLEPFEWWSMHPLLGEKLAHGKPSSVIGCLQWNRIETLLD